MMDLYKVILVDDEDDVRGRIISKIKPESGFEVIGKAGNGYDAIELIEELKPDVIITDIRMPFIDGIELAKIVRRDYPTTKIAFISGYDEFDYARKAIDLNIVSYLMKPISSDDIAAFLSKLKQVLDQEQKMLNDTEFFQNKYNESIPLILDSYLSTYILKPVLSNEDIIKIESLGYDLSHNNYLTGLIHIQEDNQNQVEQIRLFIRNMIDRVFETYHTVFHFGTREGIAFIVGDNTIHKSNEIDSKLFEIRKYAEEYYHTDLRIGVSTKYLNFKLLPKTFLEAEEAMQHSKFYNLGDIIYYDEVETYEKKYMVLEDSIINDFEYAIKFWNEEELDQVLTRIKLRFEEETTDYILNQNYLVVSLSNSLIKVADAINVSLIDVEPNLIQKLLSLPNIQELLNHIKYIAKEMKKQNVEVQVNRAEELVRKAKNYIEKNYHDVNISLELVADYVNISVSYLGMLFKKIEQITFNKYLIKFRMEKAKEELKFTSEKIINIATKCGYNEVYYFSHSFKKYTGYSPKEYRNLEKSN